MNPNRLLLSLLLPLLVAAGPATRPVSSKLLTLHDPARNRDIPLKIYYPSDASPTPSPVILFSHGLGGSRDGYAYIGQALASHGYVVAHLTHLGSDTSILLHSKNPLAELPRAGADPANIVNRPADVSFTIDQLGDINTNDPDLKGRLDPKTVGLAGHSFGAYTVLACIGQVFPTPLGDKSFLDPRISAACAMSSPTPHDTSPENLDHAFSSIKTPCLHLTGTLDDSPIGNSKAPDRRLPFDHSTSPDTYLVTFTGADHMTFSGRPRARSPLAPAQLRAVPGNSADPASDATFHPLITQSLTSFFDAYLKHDPAAKHWLISEFPKLLADHGTFEQKQQK